MIAIIAPTLVLKDQIVDKLQSSEVVPGDYHHRIASASSSTDDIQTKQMILNLKSQRNDEQSPKIYVFCSITFNLLLQKYPEAIQFFSAVLIDEVHLATIEDEMRYESLMTSKKGFVLGLTATLPTRVNNCCVFYRFPYRKAVKNAVCIPWNFQPHKIDYDNPLNDIFDILESPVGAQGRLCKEFCCLVFVKSVEVAENLERFLRQRMISAKPVHYLDSRDQRRHKLNQFNDAEVTTLIAVNSLREGFDSYVDVIIYAKNIKPQDKNQPTLAANKMQTLIQILGRATRNKSLSKRSHLSSALVISPEANEFAFEAVKEFQLTEETTSLYEEQEQSQQVSDQLDQQSDASVDQILPHLMTYMSSRGALPPVESTPVRTVHEDSDDTDSFARAMKPYMGLED